MDAQSYTAQERRAANQVWAAAGAYGFEPLFLARYTDGTTDFYMNTVVGLIHKYYGDALIRSVFDAWDGDLRQTMLDDMTWLYLENAAYRLELPRRPVLEALRFAHADYFFAIQYKLSRQEWMAKNQLVYTMQAARWRKVLGHTAPVMTPYESSLAAALEPEAVPEPAQLKNDLLALFAKFALFDGEVRQKPALHLRLQGFWAKLATKTMPTQMIKTDRVTVEHSGAVDATGSGLAVDKRRANITLKQRAAQDRAYIESCFGHCFYPPEQLRKAEQELCTGVHLGCHLWFSAGVPSPAQAPTPEARQLAQQAELQAERNRAYYAKNQELHRSVVLRLTEQIRNCILVHQQPDQRVARSGNLCAGRVWRAPYLNDNRVFLSPEEENCPAFTVDLLLDASASKYQISELIPAYKATAAFTCTDYPDAGRLADLFARMKAEITACGEDALYNEIEFPLAQVLADMTRTGVLVDKDGIEQFGVKLREELEQVLTRIHMETGSATFNPNSPKQLGEMLFDTMGLPHGKKTQRGWSTDAETLESLREYPLVEDVLQYRAYQKLNSTYVEGLLKVMPKGGYCDACFTGRYPVAIPESYGRDKFMEGFKPRNLDKPLHFDDDAVVEKYDDRSWEEEHGEA